MINHASNLLEFSAPLLDRKEALINFYHYSEIVTTPVERKFCLPEFSGIVLNMAGNVEWQLRRKTHSLKANSYQLFNIIDPNCNLTLRPGAHKMLLIDCPEELLSTFDESIFGELLSAKANKQFYSLPAALPIFADILGYVLQMYSCTSRALQDIVLFSKTVGIMTTIVDQSRRNIDPRERIPNFHAIQAARNLIKNDLNRIWTLDDLADATNISRRQLTNGFRKFFGVSPIQFHYEERLAEALKLLQTSAMPIREISGIVGYKNPQNFSQAFSKHYGQSPKKYRPNDAV